MDANNLGYYGACAPGRSPGPTPRTGDPVQIAGYLGTSDVFDRAIADFAEQYAVVNAHDHAMFLDAIKDGSVQAVT